MPEISEKKRHSKNAIYTNMILNRSVYLPFNKIGANVKEMIEKDIVNNIEGKCDVDGFIKQNSCVVKTFSSGVIKGNNIVFDVMFECDVCHPVEGQLIKCQVKNITRAGIRAIYNGKENTSPITIFVARDHHYNNEEFAKITENQDITIKVIGIRYELNDESISVLGELKVSKTKVKTKVTIIDE